MILRLILLFILIMINGVLSSSEIAFISLDKYSISRKRDKKSKQISKMLQEEDRFLSTIQIGITFAGFLASAFASDSFTDIILDTGFTIINYDFTEVFLLVVITIILSYVTLVLGELVPKKIGRANPERVARLTVSIISVIAYLFRPLISFLTFSTDLICKILKIKEYEDTLTENDIKKMIITGKREGVIEEKEKEYILNIFEFNDKTANKIMTPREKVITINVNDNRQTLISKIKKGRYTRFPILDEDGIKVLGYINIKDFIYLHKSKGSLTIKQLLHPTLVFKKYDKIDAIFRLMQEKHETFSCIVDKDEQFIGILTMEDAIEEIVGNIEDEYSSMEEKKEN